MPIVSDSNIESFRACQHYTYSKVAIQAVQHHASHAPRRSRRVWERVRPNTAGTAAGAALDALGAEDAMAAGKRVLAELEEDEEEADAAAATAAATALARARVSGPAAEGAVLAAGLPARADLSNGDQSNALGTTVRRGRHNATSALDGRPAATPPAPRRSNAPKTRCETRCCRAP